MAKIKLLSAEVIKKIAAGEVIERPASIIKELLENSLDAGATKIAIKIASAGLSLIEISDNGEGMDQADLKSATQLHSTSKLSSIEDLEQIFTFGFRGEALASIEAVADLTIISATTSKQAYSRNESGEVLLSSRSQGTTIIVKNLFRKLPARRKFLKSERTEETLCREVIRKLAVINSNVEFSYSVDDKLLLTLTPTAFLNRFAEIYKFKVQDLLSLKGDNTVNNTNSNDVRISNGVKSNKDSKDSKYSKYSMSGLVSTPKLATSNRKAEQLIAINGRLVRSPMLAVAVKQGFAETLPPELYPNFAISLKIEGADLDINIHPRKEEIKISNEGELFSFVKNIVAETLRVYSRNLMTERFQDGSFSSLETATFSRSAENSRPGNGYTYPQITSSSSKVQDSLDFSKNLLNLGSKQESEIPWNSNNSKKLNSLASSGTKFLQIFDTYLVGESPTEMIVIDQHAAAERINYEKLQSQLLNGSVQKIPYLIPITLEIPFKLGTDSALISEFSKLGFDLELFGQDSDNYVFKITALPAILANSKRLKAALAEFTTDLLEQQIDLTNIKRGLDLVCATLACHSSIRAGDKLDSLQIQRLVTDLAECVQPYSCPHGRPVIWAITRTELEKQFLRIK